MKKAIIFLALLPIMLIAQPEPEQHQPCREMKCKGLDLTDPQKEKMHDMKIELKKKTIKLKLELELAQIELRELMRDDVTGKKLDTAIDKVADLKSKMFKMQINSKVALRNILNDEQKEKMKQMKMMKHKKRQMSQRKSRNMRKTNRHFRGGRGKSHHSPKH